MFDFDIDSSVEFKFSITIKIASSLRRSPLASPRKRRVNNCRGVGVEVFSTAGLHVKAKNNGNNLTLKILEIRNQPLW